MSAVVGNDLIDVHCNNCGRKIAEVKMKEGVISITCPKCKTVNIQETKAKRAASTPKANS